MAWGLPSLDDLKEIPGIDSFTESEEERRRKKRKKKKTPPVPKTKKEKSLFERVAGASILDIADKAGAPVPKILKSVPKNVAEIGASFIPAAGAVGRAAWHDRNVSIYDMFDSKSDLQNFLNLAKWTVADERGDKRKQPKTDSELLDMTAAMLRAWGRGIEKALPDPTNKRDREEAGHYWQDEPVYALMDLLPVASMISRPLSAGANISKIAKANELSAAAAVRAGIRESYRPGSAAAAGLEGGIGRRIHRAEMKPGVFEEAPGRPWSRNPLMREFQGIYDNIFEASDTLSQRRVGRVKERADRETKRRIDLETQTTLNPVAKLVYGKMGRNLSAFGLKKSMTPAERRRATALAYIFQAPRNIDWDKTLQAVESDLTETLQRGHVELKDGKTSPLTADDKHNLAVQVSDLNLVRQELSSGKVGEGEMEAALEALQEIAAKNSEMGHTILRDFRRLAPEELDQVLATWDDRAKLLHRRLIQKGHFTSVDDAPERDEWFKVLSEHPNIGPEQAAEGIAQADRLAQAARPHDPASWWAERVGSPEGITADELSQRTGTGTYFQSPGTRQVVTGEATSPFFSPLQRWVDEKMPKRMPAQDLQNVIVKNISKEEFYNAGLDLYFDAIPPNAMIHKLDFQDHLGNELNAYNLEEQLLVYGNDAGHDTKWDTWSEGALLSRDPSVGEYSELLMRLPGEGRDALEYGGKGFDHWQQSNVIAHVRFQIFEEDGKTKLLIEEIQSDWASDARRAKSHGEEFRGTPTDEEIGQLGALEDKADAISQDIENIRDEIYRLDDEIRYAPDSERDPLYARRDSLDAQYRALKDSYYDIQDGIERINKRGIPPPPLGEKYHRAILRRVMREAAEEGVDEIVMVDPTTQAARNSFHHDLMRGDAGAHPSDIRASYHGEDLGAFQRLYGDAFPTFLAKEYGMKGDYSRAAYRGRYSTQGGQFSIQGDMPGLIFKVSEEAKAKALRPQPLYQRSPNPANIPKGANELLANGNRLVHMFEEGDISTWLHELSHSALYDLAKEDLEIIQRELAGGKPLDQWKTTDHERFARAFEQYMKNGKAPSGALLQSFKKISQWITEIWDQIKQKDIAISPATREVFDRMVDGPGGSTEPWGYFPHNDFTELASQDFRGGVRPPAAGSTIGRPRLDSATIQRNKNELIRYQTGRLAVDPMQVVDVYLRRLRFTETLKARDELWEMGTPLSEGRPPQGAWLIRNPDATPEWIRPEIKAAVEGRPTSQRVDVEKVESDLTIEPDDVKKEIVAKASDNPRWARDEENVRWVPGEYVKARYEDVFNTKPRGSLSSGLGLLNSLQRITGIYGRPISYVGGNIPFNAMALLATAPVSSMMHMGETFSMRRRNPRLYHAIASEGGETRAGAGLPEFYTKGVNMTQRAERQATAVQRGIADKLSGVADTPFRVAAFLNNARKLGYKTERQIEDLIEEGGHDLSDIRQRTREQMLDFDALNPTQRRLASNLLYLWPFIYASMKWPLMFTREYPVRAALFAQQLEASDEHAPQAIQSLWQKHGVDLSTFNPLGPLSDIAEQTENLVNNPSSLDLTVLQDRLAPTISAAVEGMGGGKENALQNIIRQTIPLAAEYYSKDPTFRGGKQYADQGRWDYLLQRHTRFWPRHTNDQVIKERVEKWRKDRITTDTHDLEMEADKQKLSEHIDKIGGYSEEDSQKILTSYNAWWDYQQAVDEKKDATGQRKLTNSQQAGVLDEIVREHFPEVAQYLLTPDQVEKMSDEDADSYVEKVKDYINEGRTMVFNDYRSYAAP